VVGDAILDSYLEGVASGLSPDGPVPAVKKTSEQRLAGGGANAAANGRALGADVDLVAFTGRDPAAGFLRAALRERGVSEDGLIEDDFASTIHQMRILADGQHVVRFDEGETRYCSIEGRRRLLARMEEAFERCEVVIISDHGQGTVSDEVVAKLHLLRETRPVPLVVNSNDLYRFRKAGATFVTAGHRAVRSMVEYGRAPLAVAVDGGVHLTEMERTGRQLLGLMDAQHVCIRMGGEGIFLIDQEGTALHLPAQADFPTDANGVGDTLAVAVGLALAAGGSPVEAARIGLDAAGIVATKGRTAVVHHDELLQRVGLWEHRTFFGSPEPKPQAPRRTLATVAAGLAAERLLGRTIVFTDGVFDILHAGHVEFLRQAKELGDVLVVGLRTDRSTRRLKGRGRPINPEGDRLSTLEALESVDHVVTYDEDSPGDLIRALRPHLHVKGGNYADKELPEADAVREAGARIVILPRIGSRSTSSLLDRLSSVGNGHSNGAPASRPTGGSADSATQGHSQKI
jgi:D-beta-D-heptose 7-phosphate kinase/D-beta-D-heptose 1-phosphate adenosyltransferase